MAFDELEQRRCERVMNVFVDSRRPPPHIRPQLDLGYRISRQSVEIFEIRPRWDKPSQKAESAVAKATFVRTQQLWRIFWQRADLKWHRYDPVPEVNSLEDFVSVVDADEYSCFFG